MKNIDVISDLLSTLIAKVIRDFSTGFFIAIGILLAIKLVGVSFS